MHQLNEPCFSRYFNQYHTLRHGSDLALPGLFELSND